MNTQTQTLGTDTNQLEAILRNKSDWELNGKYNFQNILETLYIEVEEELAAQDKANDIELANIKLDAETEKEVSQTLFKEDESWVFGSEQEEYVESESVPRKNIM